MRIMHLKEDLYKWYSGQTAPQPLYVLIDGKIGLVTADYNPEIGNAITFDEYNNRTLTVGLLWPAYKAETINDFLEENKNLLEKILDSYEEHYHDQGAVLKGSWDEKLVEEFTEICTKLEGDLSIWEPDEWFLDFENTEFKTELKIENLSDLAEEIENDAYSENVVLRNLTEYLEEKLEKK